MLEKIRVSLWDIFTFFLTGFACTAAAGWIYHINSDAKFRIDYMMIFSLNPVTIAFILAMGFTLIGMIFEPFANYFDAYIIDWIWKKCKLQKTKHKTEETILEKEISEHYLGSLNGKIDKPFSICKEYVETKQLSTTFMVFLSRYGFYRNCILLSFVFGLCATIMSTSILTRIGSIALTIIGMFIFKLRSSDFYGYMGPAVFRAFLIDKNDWTYR